MGAAWLGDGDPQVYGFVQVVIKYRSHRDCKLTIVILIVFVCLNNEKDILNVN